MDPQERPEDSQAVDIASLARELELAATGTTEAEHGGDSLVCPIIIGKVGDGIRNIDPVEYIPHHVSIGPYHRATNISRDEEKTRRLGEFLSAAKPGVTVKIYLEELKDLREQVTRCYQHREFVEGICNKDFVRMLLLDACYLLTKFGDIDKYEKGCQKSTEPGGDGSMVSVPAAGSEGALMDVEVGCCRDVFYLVENQLPFFVIDRIHRLSQLEGSDSAAVTMCRYVQKLMLRLRYSIAEPDVKRHPGPGNLLHLVHMYFKPNVPLSCPGGAATGKSMGRWRTATDYNLAGVKFKKQTLRRDGCQSILDVRLVDRGATLEIPFLDIDGNTWALLRNLVALEQHNSGTTGRDVTAYCSFMSQLACMSSAVELLVRRGIISHVCGNHDDVAGYFSDLVKGVVDSNQDDESNYLRGIWQVLEKRYESRHVRWMAWLRQKYFRNPWLTVGLAAAGVALACAVVQAVYSVLSYKH